MTDEERRTGWPAKQSGKKTNTILPVVVVVFLAFITLAVFYIYREISPSGNDNEAESISYVAEGDEVEINDDSLRITGYQISGGELYPGDIVEAVLMLEKKGDSDTYWIGCSLRDPLKNWHDIPAIEITLEEGKDSEAAFEWTIPEGLVSGPYLLTMAVWSDLPGSETARRLATVTREEAFDLLNYYEDFSDLNEDFWERSSHPLGAGELQPENVQQEAGQLKLTLPAGTLNGGQLASRENNHLYGSYRISMKLPELPSSITGFFLYAAPDFYHEVDIEVFNDRSGDIWFTTYADGIESNKYETNLGFDPTADFHEYRFDFYPGKVSFYVDNSFITSFSEGLTDSPMYLMVNSWFPRWLDQEPGESDKKTIIEWIKY